MRWIYRSVRGEIHLQSNKNRLYKYNSFDSYVAGLSLTSLIVRKILKGELAFSNSYVKAIGNELFLVGFCSEPIRLLLQKREIKKIIESSKKNGYSILPSSFFLKNRRIKLEIHLCKYNKNHLKEKKNKKYLRSKEKGKLLDLDY